MMLIMRMTFVVMGVVFMAFMIMAFMIVASIIVMAQISLRLFIAMVVNDVVVGMRFVAMLMIMRRLLVGLLGLDLLGAGAFDHIALHAVAMATAARIALARTAAIGTVFAFFLGLAMGALIGLDQRLPVGDRDLVIIGMDFAEGQETVTVAAIFDEGGLQRRFDPGDFGEIDITAKLLALGGLEIELFNAIAADHNDPGLFRVGSIDQHFVGHFGTHDGGGRVWRCARVARPGDATVHLIRG